MAIQINGTTGISGVDGSASTPAYQGTDTNTGIHFPAADTVAIDTGGTEALRVDSSRRLLVGTSSAVALNGVHAGVNIHGASGNPAINFMRSQNAASITDNSPLGFFQFGSQDGGIGASIFARAETGWSSTSDCPSRLEFSTTADGASSPTERMRITNDGKVGINGNPTSRFEVRANDSTEPIAYFTQTSTSFAQSAVFIDVNRATTNGSYNFLRCFQQGSTDKLFIRDSGNVVNANNSYGAISDLKLKENIVDANSQWNDLKALQVRNYNFKEGQTHTQIGLIAQEVELVSPGLVDEAPDRDAEGNDLGTVTKSVNYSVLYMKAVKALQEAMERIEQLEAEMAEIKAQLS